ncbi:MAG: hypothetical protein FWG13_01705 [Leptospirales bacterium]|nr:hypothetical protein [Leptospirales bacterium]
MNIKTSIKTLAKQVKRTILTGKDSIASFINAESYGWNDKLTNRRLIITLASIFFLDYIMFCYHTGRNIFAIFPSVPPISLQREITVYLPSLDGKTIIDEKRKTVSFESEERFVQFLVDSVAKGSLFENTAMTVPAEINIRKVWILEKSAGHDGKDICAVDCEPIILESGIKPLPGSEELFKKALTQTITANIPHISDVVLLAGGIPDRKFW